MTPENEQTDFQASSRMNESAVAPTWHSVVLILGILAISFAGRHRVEGMHGTPHRLLTYATTAGMELAMLGWVALGLLLRKVPLRSLFGVVSSGIRGLALDLGVAAVFWFGALMTLGTISIFWTSVEVAIAHARSGPHAAQDAASLPNRETLRTLEQLAPANGVEVGCWILLCCIAGTVEELVFRGYLQRQFTAWTKGDVVWGVVFSALLFGAAHGYQGVRNMVLLAVFGAFFSGLALVRRSLRAGMIAHGWHDLVAGLTLAFLRAHHLL